MKKPLKRIVWVCLVVAATPGWPAEKSFLSNVKDAVDIEADLLKFDKEGQYNPQLTLSVDAHGLEAVDGPSPWLDSKIQLQADPEEGGKQSHVEAGIRFRHSWYDPAAVGSFAGVSNAPSGEDRSRDFGAAELALVARVESDQQLEDINGTAATVASYLRPSAARQRLWAILPYAEVAFEYVQPLEDESRLANGGSDEAFPRVRYTLFWDTRDYDATNGGWGLTLRWSEFRELDQSDERQALGNDTYGILETRLAWHPEIPAKIWGALALTKVYIAYSTGRELPDTEDEERYVLGIGLL